MMFYVQGLIQLEDLQITPNFCRQIMDLFCDIAWQTQAEAPNEMVQRQMQDLQQTLVQQNLAQQIWNRFEAMRG